MKKTIVKTEAAPVPLSPISQAIKAGPFIYTSGQLGRDPGTGNMAGPIMSEQARQALKNTQAVVEAAGGSLKSIIRIEGLVTNLDLMGEFNTVFKEFFPVDPPTRCCFEVQRLAAGALVEVNAVALAEHSH